jgi:hypothetical protein
MRTRLFEPLVIHHPGLNRATGLEAGGDYFDEETGRRALDKLRERMSLEIGITDHLVTVNAYMAFKHGPGWVSLPSFMNRKPQLTFT